jgi:hypothetical protein
LARPIIAVVEVKKEIPDNMYRMKNAIATVSFVVVLSSLPLHAKDNCKLPQLMHQHKDAATVQRLEDAWSIAFLHGDTEFMRCLLIPEFTEIMRSGALKFLPDELDMAAKNRGQNLPVPELPKAKILIHQNVAVAYGISNSVGADGKTQMRRYADSYVWRNGQWHVFFGQQTPVENH